MIVALQCGHYTKKKLYMVQVLKHKMQGCVQFRKIESRFPLSLVLEVNGNPRLFSQ